MDKIWDKKILQSRKSLAVVAGMEKTKWPRRTDKSRTQKKYKKKEKKVLLYKEADWTILPAPLEMIRVKF